MNHRRSNHFANAIRLKVTNPEDVISLFLKQLTLGHSARVLSERAGLDKNATLI